MFPVNGRPRIRSGLSRPNAQLNRQVSTSRDERPLTTPSRVTPYRSPKSLLNTPSAASSNDSPAVLVYFAVLYTKRSKKKRKSWLDGYIIIKNDRFVELLNEDGKKIASERYKPLGGMKEGNTLQISSWELEVQNEVKEDDYISGRLFVKPTVQNIVASARPKGSAPRKRVLFKPLRPKNTSNDPSNVHREASGPIHNPKAPNAYVLMDTIKDKLTGVATIPIVLDPFLAKRMRPHQKEGVKFLYKCVQGSFFLTGEGGQGAILADEMGLGKSLQALALIWTLLKQSPKGTPFIKKAVIVCPASLVENWVNEVNKWLGFDRIKPVAVTSGSSTFESKEALASFINGGVKKLLIVSYEMFRSYSEQLYKSKIGLMVCDEGHRLKSSQGNKTIEALRGLPCRARVILSGTPVQNDLEEFFAVCDFVNPGCLNSLTSFRQVFANPIIASRDSNASAGSVRMGIARSKELGRITSCFVLRRNSNILAKYLPPKHEIAVFCRLPEVQEACYKKEAKDHLYEISNCSRFSAALSAITSLRKICCHPVLVNNGARIDYGDDGEVLNGFQSVNEKPANTKSMPTDFKISDSTKMQITLSICQSSLVIKDRVILVSNYTSALDLLQNALSRNNISFCRLDGGTPVNQRGDIVRRFNAGSLGDVFLLSAKAGGVGLNLIGANRLILFDPDWNPATDLQAMARVWRDGQKKPVFVYRLLCTGTIEEKIFQRQLFKGELQSAVDGEQDVKPTDGAPNRESTAKLLGSNEGNFSAAELRDLFQYNANLKFCDTLGVLERSQEDSLLSKDANIPRPAALLKRFSVFKERFEKDGIEGDVLCEDDPVLEKSLNGYLDTQGLVSYLFTTKTDGALSSKSDIQQMDLSRDRNVQNASSTEPPRKKKLESMFESDSGEGSSSEEDVEIKVALAMRGTTKKRNKKPSTEVDNVSEVESAVKRIRKSNDDSTNTFGDESDKKQENKTLDAQMWDDALNELEEDFCEDF